MVAHSKQQKDRGQRVNCKGIQGSSPSNAFHMQNDFPAWVQILLYSVPSAFSNGSTQGLPFVGFTQQISLCGLVIVSWELCFSGELYHKAWVAREQLQGITDSCKGWGGP